MQYDIRMYSSVRMLLCFTLLWAASASANTVSSFIDLNVDGVPNAHVDDQSLIGWTYSANGWSYAGDVVMNISGGVLTDPYLRANFTNVTVTCTSISGCSSTLLSFTASYTDTLGLGFADPAPWSLRIVGTGPDDAQFEFAVNHGDRQSYTNGVLSGPAYSCLAGDVMLDLLPLGNTASIYGSLTFPNSVQGASFSFSAMDGLLNATSVPEPASAGMVVASLGLALCGARLRLRKTARS